jgi:protein-disulfide isomerase
MNVVRIAASARIAILASVATLAITALVATVAGRQGDPELKKELSGIRQEVQALRAQLSKAAPAARARPPGPDPKKVYAVATDDAPSMGPADAPLTLVMAYEYACPWCDRQRQVFDEIKQAYGDDVRFVFRPFVVHPDEATPAALAACAAERQGKFAAVHDALWRDVFGKRAFDRASAEKAASIAGVDGARLRADMDGACTQWLAAQGAALRPLGVTGTPMVWVNGRPVAGGFKTLAQMKPLLDEELARARERIAAGTPRASYYAEWVMKKGLTRLDGTGT